MHTGLSIDDLLSSDLALEMVIEELQYRWTQDHELLAYIGDQLGYLTRVMLQAYGAKNLPPITTYPRPQRDKKEEAMVPATNVISFGQFKEMIGKE